MAMRRRIEEDCVEARPNTEPADILTP